MLLHVSVSFNQSIQIFSTGWIFISYDHHCSPYWISFLRWPILLLNITWAQVENDSILLSRQLPGCCWSCWKDFSSDYFLWAWALVVVWGPPPPSCLPLCSSWWEGSVCRLVAGRQISYDHGSCITYGLHSLQMVTIGPPAPLCHRGASSTCLSDTTRQQR